MIAGKKLDPVGTATFFEGASIGTLEDSLITKVPQKLTYLPSRVVDGSGNDEALPQPSPSLLRVKKAADLDVGEPPGRLLSDVGILTVSGKIKVGV